MNHNRHSLSLQGHTKQASDKSKPTQMSKQASEAQLHQKYMKCLIASNADYFKSKRTHCTRQCKCSNRDDPSSTVSRYPAALATPCTAKITTAKRNKPVILTWSGTT